MNTPIACSRGTKVNLYTQDHIGALEKEYRKLMTKTFGQVIKTARKMCNQSQEDIAAAAAISEKYYGEIERGVKTPGIVVAQKIVAALKIPPCRIFSAESCPNMNRMLTKELEEALRGLDERGLEKAVKILRILGE